MSRELATAEVLDQLVDLRGMLASEGATSDRTQAEPPVGRNVRQGTLERVGEHADGSSRFRFRLRLADGTKSPRMDVPSGQTAIEARGFVTAMQALEDERHGLLDQKRANARTKRSASAVVPEEETFDAWFDRYLPTKECGEGHRRITGAIVRKWVSPVLGAKGLRALTRDDIEDVRDRLDSALDAKEIRPATARNVWGALTGALKAASAARDRSLRVLPTPLHYGILPPKHGESRRRPWLYPREWDVFVRCEAVPAGFRRVCALAVYTGLRPGELGALTWADVDLEARTISVSKAIDSYDGTVKAPKTARGQRVIPIQENLVPLLTAFVGAEGDGVVAALGGFEADMAVKFRRYLKVAGIVRPRLSADNATEEPVDFRSLRDTHATWLALAGVAAQVIQRRLGHAQASTTDRYVKVAEMVGVGNVGRGFGGLGLTAGT